MGYHTISILKSIVFIGILVMATYLGVPKSLHFWELWKKTKKPLHLANLTGCITITFFLYSAAFIIMVMRLVGLA